MNKLPAWLRYDKLVLRFGAFVREKTHDPTQKFNPVTRQLETSSAESFKVRRFQIQFYMGDKGAIQVVEDSAAGGGQRKGPGNGGTFLRKTNDLKLALPDGSGTRAYAATDFYVGAKLEISGRTFHVVTCDKATRNFFSSEHPDHHVGRNLDWPARHKQLSAAGHLLIYLTQQRKRCVCTPTATRYGLDAHCRSVCSAIPPYTHDRPTRRPRARRRKAAAWRAWAARRTRTARGSRPPRPRARRRRRARGRRARRGKAGPRGTARP